MTNWVSIIISSLAALSIMSGAELPAAKAQQNDASNSSFRLAQSGSVGGRAGRGRKDLSGGGKKTVKRRPAGSSVAGRWRWTARCSPFGNWVGSFFLRGPASSFSGSFHQDQPGGDGRITAGRAGGGKVSFKLNGTWGGVAYVQTWSGSFTGRHMVGSIAGGPGSCSWTANR
jgi:hypothetical protein